ncbi:uncharacterized protein LOC141898667 isoform X2 [Tubulanus polymorphus]|uniref:uncharacterized protein LOC141898667 isoform X2 n=1 Tax=Tubulanus polymorphus TaxID=672921 RepID=UPI003DA47627
MRIMKSSFHRNSEKQKSTRSNWKLTFSSKMKLPRRKLSKKKEKENPKGESTQKEMELCPKLEKLRSIMKDKSPETSVDSGIGREMRDDELPVERSLSDVSWPPGESNENVDYEQPKEVFVKRSRESLEIGDIDSCHEDIDITTVEQFFEVEDVGEFIGRKFEGRKSAVGVFDQNGGCLRFKDGSCYMIVPPNALSQPAYIYMRQATDDINVDEGHVPLAPSIECHPDGLKFDATVLLAVKRYTGISFSPDHQLTDNKLSWRQHADTVWNIGAVVETLTNGFIAMPINHFTLMTPVVPMKYVEKQSFAVMLSARISGISYHTKLRLLPESESKIETAKEEELCRGNHVFPERGCLCVKTNGSVIVVSMEELKGIVQLEGHLLNKDIQPKYLLHKGEYSVAFATNEDPLEEVGQSCLMKAYQDENGYSVQLEFRGIQRQMPEPDQAAGSVESKLEHAFSQSIQFHTTTCLSATQLHELAELFKEENRLHALYKAFGASQGREDSLSPTSLLALCHYFQEDDTNDTLHDIAEKLGIAEQVSNIIGVRSATQKVEGISQFESSGESKLRKSVGRKSIDSGLGSVASSCTSIRVESLHMSNKWCAL